MGVRRRSDGRGAVATTRTKLVAVQPKDRSHSGVPARPAAIPATDEHDDLRHLLDGEVIRYPAGFQPATALRIAKTQGIISAKLEAMDEDAREVLLALTIPKLELRIETTSSQHDGRFRICRSHAKLGPTLALPVLVRVVGGASSGVNSK
jgi:hypothetical protein